MAEDIGIGGRARLLRRHRRRPRRDPEPPPAGARPDRDGSRSPSPPTTCAIEKEKALRAVALPANSASTPAAGQYATGWQGGCPVAGLPRGGGHQPGEHHRDLRRHPGRRRAPPRVGRRPSTCVPASAFGRRVTEVAVVFKRAPHLPFAQDRRVQELSNNAFVFRIQPDEGITVRFGSKVPDTTSVQVRDVTMDFQYGESFVDSSPEAYERAHPRRAARRSAALPAPRGRSSSAGDPRPGPRPLGGGGPAGGIRVRWRGDRSRPTT